MNIKHTPAITLILLCILSCGQPKNNNKVADTPAPQAPERTADQVNYYLVFDSVAVITPDTQNAGKAVPYNNELIVEPGIYNIGRQNLNMEEEGLYRVL